MSLRAPIQMTAHQGSVLVTGPAVEPVTAAELRAHLRADTGILPDAEADALIEEARQEVEEQTGLALINQSWRLSLDQWPGARQGWWSGTMQASISEIYGARGIVGTVDLPRYPVGSVTSVTVYDDASIATSVDVAAVFDVDTYQRPGRIRLKSGQAWPVALRPTNAIEVVYVAGYGAGADAVPSPLKRAIKLMASYMFQHRGDGCDATEAMGLSGAAAILSKYKVRRV